MNLELLDPFAKTVPDHVDSVLTYGVEDATVCCFDRRGTYLAVGYTTGVVVIWDFITRGIGRVIEAHARAVTALSWAGGGRRLLSASHDHRLHLWALNQPRPELVRVICFDKPVLSAMMLPRNFGGAIALTADGIAYMVDIKQCTFSPLLNTEEAFGRNSSGVHPGSSKKARPSEQGVASRSVPHSLPGVLCMELDRRTRSVSLGTANGKIISVRANDGGVSHTVSVVGCSKVTQMDFSRDGKWMLVNSGERVIRMLVRQGGTGKSVRDFQDVVNRTRWQCCRFTGDSEYVAGGSKAEADCSIYIWAVGGHLVTRLEGPQVTLRSLARHPVRPFLAAAMDHGKVQLWGTTHTANWTAFAADFEELEENVEYVEKEDEFDVVVAAQDSEGRGRKAAEREKQGEEVIVSIDAIDTVAAWSSDSDAENGTPFYLSTEPGAASREGWYDLEIQTSKGRKVPQQRGRGRNELQEDDREEWKTVRVDRRQVKKSLGVKGVYESIGDAFAGDQGTLHNVPPGNKKKKRPVTDFPVEGGKGQKGDKAQSSSGGSKSNSKIEKRVYSVQPRAGGGGGGRGRVGGKLSKLNKHQGRLGEGSSSSRAVAFSSGRSAGDKRQERALAVSDGGASLGKRPRGEGE